MHRLALLAALALLPAKAAVAADSTPEPSLAPAKAAVAADSAPEPSLAPAKAAVAADSTPEPSSSSSPAIAVPNRGWMLNGATVGVGRNYLLGQIGWPGLSLSLQHGVSERFDVGGSFSFVYGLEGVPDVAPGLKLNAILKLNLISMTKFNFGVRLDPGLALYFPSNGVYNTHFQTVHFNSSVTTFGLQFPLEILAGVVPISMLSIHFGMSMPMVLFFTPDVSFLFPFEPGAGVEYKVDSSLTLTFDSRFGPTLFVVSGDTHSEFAFRLQFGVGYRF